jgi:hypothetical protein
VASYPVERNFRLNAFTTQHCVCPNGLCPLAFTSAKIWLPPPTPSSKAYYKHRSSQSCLLKFQCLSRSTA